MTLLKPPLKRLLWLLLPAHWLPPATWPSLVRGERRTPTQAAASRGCRTAVANSPREDSE